MDRRRIVSFRVTDAEHKQIQKRAERAGLDISEAVRRVALQPDVAKLPPIPPSPGHDTHTFSAAHRAMVFWGNGQYGTTCTLTC